MSNPLTATLGVPQTLALAPPRFQQTAEWYEHQQATSLPTTALFASGLRRLAGNDSSRAYSYEQTIPKRSFATQLRSIQRHYTILDSDSLIVERLEEEPALYELLMEAVTPLKKAFGEGRIVQVQVQFSEDDSLVKVAVQLPPGFGGDPECALQCFDQEWWLKNCHRSGGALVFDYEIQDAI